LRKNLFEMLNKVFAQAIFEISAKKTRKKLERTQQFEIEEVFRETSVYHDGLQYFSWKTWVWFDFAKT